MAKLSDCIWRECTTFHKEALFKNKKYVSRSHVASTYRAVLFGSSALKVLTCMRLSLALGKALVPFLPYFFLSVSALAL